MTAIKVDVPFDFHLGAFGIRPGRFLADVSSSGVVTLKAARLNGFFDSNQHDILHMIRSIEVLSQMKELAKVTAGIDKVGDAIFDWDGPEGAA